MNISFVINLLIYSLRVKLSSNRLIEGRSKLDLLSSRNVKVLKRRKTPKNPVEGPFCSKKCNQEKFVVEFADRKKIMICKCEFSDKSIFIHSIIGYNQYAQQQLILDNDTISFKNSTSLMYKELIGVLDISPFANIIEETELFDKFTLFCFLGLCINHYYAFFTYYIQYIVENDMAKIWHQMLFTKVLRNQEDKDKIYRIFFEEYMKNIFYNF